MLITIFLPAKTSKTMTIALSQRKGILAQLMNQVA